MRVLAEIRWCDTHGKSVIVADDPLFCTWGESIWESALCVVVDAQVTRTTADPTPRPYKQCPDCNGAEYICPGCRAGQCDGHIVPCPSCSVEPKQTEQNIERAADIIRRSTVRTSDLISIGGGRMGIREWDDLDPKAQDAWVALARKVIEVAEGKDE